MTLPQFLPWRSIPRKILVVTLWVVASAFVLTLPAMAQHGGHAGGHPAGGGHIPTGGHGVAPPVVVRHAGVPANAHAPLSGLVQAFSRGRFSFADPFLFVRLSSGFAEATLTGGGTAEVIGPGDTVAAAGCRTMSPLMKIM